jgi:hypothetical protein
VTTDLDTIREAARQMRARADAATPGPWYTTSESARYGGLVTAPTADYPEHDGYGGHPIGESMSAATRDHVAGWHPAVAITVADWLDSHAADLASANGDRNACDSPGDLGMALRVARAYLGTEGSDPR